MIGSIPGLAGSARRSSLWRLLLVACAAWTGAATADSYLILSLLGDHLTLVTEAPPQDAVGDGNVYEIVRMTGTALEDFVVHSADAAIQRAAPAAPVTMLRASDPTLYVAKDGWFDITPEQIHSLVAFVGRAIPPAPDARMLLIAPYLAQPQLRAATDYRGSGSVAGLGFYVSPSFQRGQGIAGFFGVFANFQLLLINPRNEAVERREVVVTGSAYSAARAPDGVAANALTPEEKIKALQMLVQGEIDQRIPAMLAPPKP